MTFAQRPLHAAPIVVTLVLALVGCSTLEPDKIDYKSSGRGVALEVPPDLTQLPGQSRYSVPGGTVTASSYAAGQAATAGATKTAVPNTIADVHYMRNGDERWLRVDRAPEKVWPLVRDFWLDNGFLIAVDNPTTGIMETDWAENRAKIPQDIIRSTLGKVFDSLYSTGERDKFRIRVERDAKGGTDIYITHRGMEEVYNSARRDSTVWQPRPRDVGLEDEFLRRLMVALGVSQEQAKAAQASASAAAAAAGPQARIVNQGGAPAIALSDDFDRAWRRVGLTLDRTGFTVEDRDRAKGIYYVRYVDPTVEKKEPGFFSKLFGGASTQLPASQYQIGVHAQGSNSLVTVQGSQGAAVPERDAQRIIKVLADDLK
ncbi:MAG: outer membrane protein assembly factor BamC [Burkholderiaceae bacterium]